MATNTGNTNISPLVNQTIWGALVHTSQTPEQQGKVIKDLGIDDCVRVSINLSTFNGHDAQLEYFQANDFTILLNINNAPHTDGAILYAHDMVKYAADLENFFQGKYGKYEMVIMIENEPLNDTYFKDDVSNYITLLKTAIPIVHKYGHQVCDGGMHVPYIVAASTNHLFNQNAKDTLALLTAVKSMGVDYVAVHQGVGNNNYNLSDVKASADYIKLFTGKTPIFTEASIANGVTSSKTITDFVNAVRNNYRYGIIFAAQESDKAEPLVTSSGALNSLGIAFRDAIK